MPAAAILHRQLSMVKELNFMNYASIGVQLGQALSHRIYQKGACVDATGMWHMNSWWSITTQKQFMSRESCHAIGPVKVSNTRDHVRYNNPCNPIIYQYEWDSRSDCRVNYNRIDYIFVRREKEG